MFSSVSFVSVIKIWMFVNSFIQWDVVLFYAGQSPITCFQIINKILFNDTGYIIIASAHNIHAVAGGIFLHAMYVSSSPSHPLPTS